MRKAIRTAANGRRRREITRVTYRVQRIVSEADMADLMKLATGRLSTVDACWQLLLERGYVIGRSSVHRWLRAVAWGHRMSSEILTAKDDSEVRMLGVSLLQGLDGDALRWAVNLVSEEARRHCTLREAGRAA